MNYISSFDEILNKKLIEQAKYIDVNENLIPRWVENKKKNITDFILEKFKEYEKDCNL